jgi:hypothetical protein
MPDFLYKPQQEFPCGNGVDVEIVPGQILAEFRGGECALDWMQWLRDNDFPSPIGTLLFTPGEDVIKNRDYSVWVPSPDHAMLHRLTWGGKIAVD